MMFCTVVYMSFGFQLKMESCIVNVYFEGTANALSNLITQVSLFADITEGYDLREVRLETENSENKRYVIAFDGCGVTNGTFGIIFASGLSDQCALVREKIEILICNGNSTITVNAVGLSRGGVAVIYLAQELQVLMNRAKIKLNLLLFDPVPGNLISTSKWLDIIGLNTANQAMSLSSCVNIDNILALYPYEPLPDFSFHAPLIPSYPSDCKVEEDACLGCHQGILHMTHVSLQSVYMLYSIVTGCCILTCIKLPINSLKINFRCIYLLSNIAITIVICPCQSMADCLRYIIQASSPTTHPIPDQTVRHRAKWMLRSYE